MRCYVSTGVEWKQIYATVMALFILKCVNTLCAAAVVEMMSDRSFSNTVSQFL